MKDPGIQGLPGGGRHTLLVLAFVLVPVLVGCSAGSPAPAAKAGVLDLTAWDFASQGSLRLDGEWAFAPFELLKADGSAAFPGEFIGVPGTWNSRLKSDALRTAHGYATYGLRIRLPEGTETLGIRVSNVATAMRLFANGRQLFRAGTVGVTASESRPAYDAHIAQLDRQSEIQLILHISNFDYAKGGVWEPIWLGSPDELRHQREGRVGLVMFLAGAFLLLGLYHLIVWLARRSDRSPLWFALLCFGIAVRGLTVDEVYLVDLVPSLPWSTLVRVEYGSILVTVGFLAVFTGAMFPKELSQRLVTRYGGSCLFLLVLVVVLPVDIFSRGLWVIQLLLVFAAVVGPYLVSLALSRRREGALFFLVGLVAIALASVHDILISIFRDLPTVDVFGGRLYLQPFGLLVFALSQAAMLALRSSRTVTALENASVEIRHTRDELDAHAKELESRVADRTSALKTANEELRRLAERDELTDLANRRTFEERLEETWNDHVRRMVPLSLVMADVDNFKSFNDRYGHLEGDKALRSLADAVAAGARRPRDVVARVGGEELVILLPDTKLAGAAKLAESIRQAVEELGIPHLDNDPPVVTLSLGVAEALPMKSKHSDSLLARADAALYRAKNAGRNCVVSDAGEPSSDSG